MKRLIAALLVVGAVFALWPAQGDAELRGLWTQYESKDVGDPLRFYYFHERGIGLYRFGKVGLNYTNSFDYEVDGDRVTLTFRKTGEIAKVHFTVERAGDERVLVMKGDPRGPGVVRYRYVPPPSSDDVGAAKGPAIGGRLWMDLRKFKTGGQGFELYQLNPGAIDGRGVGWFHRGDFDDWSTEALAWRAQGDRLELTFALSGEKASTGYRLEGDGDARELVLDADPRHGWHWHRLVDAGPSFGAFDAPLSRLSFGLYGPTGRR